MVAGLDPGTCARVLGELLGSSFAASTPVSRSRDREVHRVPVAEADRPGLGGVRTVYVKRYRPGGLWARLESLAGMHKAQRAWRLGLLLRRRGVPTPLPLLRGWRGSPLGRERLVVTAGIAGPSLRDHVDSRLPPATGAAANAPERLAHKRALLRSLAALLAAVHAARAYHGDFTSRNLLVGTDAAGGPQVVLLDIDAVRHAWRISARRRVKNLDEIGRNVLDLRVVTTADRLRFLHHYLQASGADPSGARQLFRRVWRRTRRRLRKYGLAFRGFGVRSRAT